MFPRSAIFAAALSIVAVGHAGAAEPAANALPLRVCADPGNMPLSNNKGEGFQNKVAEILAKGMGMPLQYFWYPYYGRGLVRSTLTAEKCDVLMDLPSDFELALTTKPYYKSTFVLVYPKAAHHPITNLDDPILKKWKIGVLQSSPAREVLRTHGVLENTVVQYVFFDSSYNPQDHPGKQVEQVIDGTLDAAETWGPIGGYYIAQKNAPLEMVPLNQFESDVPLEFSMSFGVRRADKDLKRRLDEAFEAHKDEIQTVLASYGVPLVKCGDCVISGDLREHGPYTALDKAKAEARLDHPEAVPGELEAAKKRIAEGADVTQELSDAVVGNDPDRVRYLLDHGADPNKVIQLDYNALQWAVREGHVKIAEILLDHGALAEQRDKDGWSPLMFAVWRNNADMMKLLIAKGAKLNLYGSSGWSPLSVAITYGKLDNVKQLVDAGADVNAVNEAGYTPVMFATAKSAEGVLDLLLKRGANASASNKAGITSLMLAAAENNDAAAAALLAAGADANAKDTKGETALEIARQKDSTKVVALLSKLR